MLAQVFTLALGVWLLLAPAVLNYGDPASSVERIVGPLVIVAAALALHEVTRPVRFAQVALGLALLVAPWMYAYSSVPAIAVSLLVGMALLALALVRGRFSHRYAGGWSAVWSWRASQRREELAPESHYKDHPYGSSVRRRMDVPEAS